MLGSGGLTQGVHTKRHMTLVRRATIAAGLLSFLTVSAEAQQVDGAALWSMGGCFNCHGNLAAGDGDAAYPGGPNLRLSTLDREQLFETIACGRPSTPMPYNLAGAYTETLCYGMPAGPPPDVPEGAGFNAEEVGALTDFLFDHVLGVRQITRENCALFFGGNDRAPLCRQYQ